MEILTQLGGLVLGSVPTMVLFLLLILIYQALVQRPLERTLAERRARTSGAVEQARGAIAMAEAETTAYEEKLRVARSQIAADRERRIQALQQQRDAQLGEARAASQERVRTARQQVEESAAAARSQIEQAAETLGQQILQAVMPKGTAAEAGR